VEVKIAFFTYPSAFQSPGGGEILFLKTKQSLEEEGLSIKVFDQWNDKLRDFDIIHIFSTEKDSLGLMLTAKKLGVKIVLSPVFWSTMQRAIHEYGNIPKRINMILRHITKVLFPIFPSARRKMCQLADIIAPNSIAEAKQISRLFSIKENKMHVVPLGCDRRFADSDKRSFVDKYKLDNFILSVGRFEPRKNQLNLIKALKGSGLKLVFIGDPVSGYEDYYNECKKTADENVLFLNRLDHENDLLSSAYAACNLFVLQGWFETPGLVALEAGLAGAKLAVTKGGSTKEYFREYAEYFNPADPKDIKEAIDRSLKKKESEELKEHILKHYLWLHAAKENIKAYKQLC